MTSELGYSLRDRLAYQPIHERPGLKLPGDARVAVWTIVNVENWSPAGAMPRAVLPPPMGQPLLPAGWASIAGPRRPFAWYGHEGPPYRARVCQGPGQAGHSVTHQGSRCPRRGAHRQRRLRSDRGQISLSEAASAACEVNSTQRRKAARAQRRTVASTRASAQIPA